MKPTIELRCSRDLALRIGVIEPEDHEHYKRMRDLGHLRVRGTYMQYSMFWPWQIDPVTARSS